MLNHSQMHRLARLLAVSIALGILAGCGNGGPGESSAQSEFEIIPDYLDEPYENQEVGIAFRPPLAWTPLTPSQREEIAAALLSEQRGEEYRLEIVDLFLHAQSFSFASLTTVIAAEGTRVERVAYTNAFYSELVSAGEDELRGRTTLRINDLEVEQVRHSVGDRVVFTLVTEIEAGRVIRLDYSIPTAAYEDQGIKLESSVGTIRSARGE